MELFYLHGSVFGPLHDGFCLCIWAVFSWCLHVFNYFLKRKCFNLVLVNNLNLGFRNGCWYGNFWWRIGWLWDKGLVAVGPKVMIVRILILCCRIPGFLVSHYLYVKLRVYCTHYILSFCGFTYVIAILTHSICFKEGSTMSTYWS